jgi:hypothetical protein
MNQTCDRSLCLHRLSTSFLLPLLLFLLSPSALLVAQEGDAYQEWLKTQQGEYDEFKNQQDKEFLEFLKQEWKKADLEPAVEPFTRPKPTVRPAFRKEPPAAEPKVAGKPIVVPEPPPRPKPIAPRIEPPEQPPPEKYASMVALDFFGVPVELRHAPLNIRATEPPTEASIRDFWKAASESNIEVIVQQAIRWKKELNLNDWGYCLLLKRTSDEIFPGKENESVLLSWYLLIKSGYDARIGYSGGSVHLLLPVTTQLFGLPYFSFAGSSHRYYAVNLGPEPWQLPASVHTYEGTYPGAARLFDFSLGVLPRLGSKPVSKTLRFTFNREIQSIPITVNKNIVDFLRLYPQTPFDVYFNAPISASAARGLVEGLTPFVKGKSEVEAVHILLRFVQTAFTYRTDQANFGREKPLFVDETLFYDASDCEDRSVLFSFLVTSLTGLPVVGLNYPGHMATAVRFSAVPAGDAVQHGAGRYTVCDPTFTFADAGRAMPEFAASEPRVIVVNQKSVVSSQ